MRSLHTALLALFALTLVGFSSSKKELAIERVKEVFRSNMEIKALSYDFVKTERIDGDMVTTRSHIKMQKRPYRVYMREIEPNPGVEILYPHPQDETMALVNPNGFPWVNLKLDPMGSLMRKGQHHTVLEGGFDYIVSVMEYIFYKYRTRLDDIIEHEGITLYDGRRCEVVSLFNENFGYVNYTVSKGETIASIATKFRLNEYMIIDTNEWFDLFHEIREGDVIKLPSDYASRMTLFIDQERQIPLMMKIYDDKGLFEKYEFKNVVLNPDLKSTEFSPTFQGYNFN